MSRIKHLTRSVGSTLGMQALTLAVSVAFLALFSRSLSKAEMALYALMGAFQVWIRLGSGLGLGTLAVREVPSLTSCGKDTEAHRLLTSCAVYTTACSVVLTVVLVLAAPLLGRAFFGSADLAGRIRLVCVAAFVLRLANCLSLMQWALQRFPVRAFCGGVNSLGARFLAAAGYILFGFEGFVLGFLIAACLAAAIHVWTLRREWTAWLMPIGPLLRRSRGYIPVEVLRSLHAGVDRPVVGLFLGPEVLAGYFVVVRCGTLFIRAIRAFSAPLGAKLSEVRSEGTPALNRYFGRGLFVLSIVFIPVGLALAALSGPLLRLVAGEGYAHCWPILAALGVLIACKSVSEFWYDAVFRLAPARCLLGLNGILCGVTLAMYCALLPVLGAAGVPLASAAACLASVVWASALLRRRRGLTAHWHACGRGLACGAAVLAAARVSVLLAGQSPRLWPYAALLVGPVYVAAAWTVAPAGVRAFLAARRAALRGRFVRSAAVAVPAPRGDAHA